MLAVLLAATVAYAAPSVPPAGKYVYVETISGHKADVTAIDVAYKGASIELNSETKPQDEHSFGAYVQARQTFDSSTLDLERYHAEVALGCSELEYSVDVDGPAAHVG